MAQLQQRIKNKKILVTISNGAMQKVDGVVGSGPPAKGCTLLDGELTHEQCGENDSHNFVDNSLILLKWGGIIKCCEG